MKDVPREADDPGVTCIPDSSTCSETLRTAHGMTAARLPLVSGGEVPRCGREKFLARPAGTSRGRGLTSGEPEDRLAVALFSSVHFLLHGTLTPVTRRDIFTCDIAWIFKRQIRAEFELE